MKRIIKLREQIKFWIWLHLWHVLVCHYWNWRLPPDLNAQVARWQRIDHRKDRSLTGKDFRGWFYIRKVDEDVYNELKK